jgi:FkbM family methyltransferase
LIGALGRGARVVAFEPAFANYARLCENIQLNDCAGLVTPAVAARRS